VMIDRRGLLLALVAGLALAGRSEAQRFDPRGSFDNSQQPQRRQRQQPRQQPPPQPQPQPGAELRRLSHDELRAIVSRQFPVREMRTSGECGREFWALIITRDGQRRWVFLDVRDGRYLRTQSYAPTCG